MYKKILKFIKRGIRKVLRLILFIPSYQDVKRRKELADYKFLIKHGVETELGYVTLYGQPLISRVNNSRIVMGRGVVIISDSQFNRSGINHKTVIATEAPGAEIIIDDGVGISGSSIVAVEKIHIGENTMLGANTNIFDTDFHPVDAKSRISQKNIMDAKHNPVKIGKQCWLGANVTVLKGVTLGDRVVVGAMSLVNKDMPNDTIVGGVPARVLSNISHIHESIWKEI
ncbi:DapH/DapD/GlmU-related protein [Paludibacter sp.]